MRFLSIALLTPWLLILGWAYWTYPKTLPRSVARRSFDALILLLAAATAIGMASFAFDTASTGVIDGQGHPVSGAIWKQVMPALYGYGSYSGVLLTALTLRWLVWRRRESRA